MQIFISYSSRNRDQVMMLAKDLEDLGHAVWFDQEIAGGQDWWSLVLARILKCDLFICALSPHWLTSDSCTREVSYAAALNKVLLPVQLADVDYTTLPAYISTFQIIDYRARTADTVIRLIRGLSQLHEPHPLPNPLPEPPAPPISALAEISQQIKTRPLPADTQHTLLNRLTQLLKTSLETGSVRELILQLENHPDVTPDIRARIGKVVGKTGQLATKDSSKTKTSELRAILIHQQGKAVRAETTPSLTVIDALDNHRRKVTCLTVAPLGNLMASASEDNVVNVWSLPIRGFVASFESHAEAYSAPLLALALSPGGNLLAVAHNDIRLWDVTTKTLLASFTDHAEAVQDIAFSPDGALLASASSDKTVKIWDVARLKPLLTFQGSEYWMRSVTFSPDGCFVAAGSYGSAILIWELETEKLARKLNGGTFWTSGRISSVEFSPDGRYLGSTVGGHVKVWETGKWREYLKYSHKFVDARPETPIAFSPDSDLIASGGTNTIAVWDLNTQQQAAELQWEGARQGVNCLAFSPDGTLLLAGCEDGRVRVWGIA